MSLRPGSFLSLALSALLSKPGMRAGMKMLKERRESFPDALAMQLAGIAMVPEVRKRFDDILSGSAVDRYIPTGREYPEVVIGSGAHAAIYCAIRVQLGFPAPVVVESGKRFGGTFAMSQGPSFYLNSGNRPGSPGLPGEGMSLNYLPGAVIQPDLITMREYSTNADMAFAIRATLANYTRKIFTGAEVIDIDPYVAGPDITVLQLSGNRSIQARRVVLATGIGKMVDTRTDGKYVMSYPQFMASLDQPFPFRGMERVAVIGQGDSGKTAVEALLGIGPSTGLAGLPALDYVRRVDWYARSLPTSCEAFRDSVRSRYGRLAAYLPRDGQPGRESRLQVIRERASWYPAFNGALVNNRPYNAVIICTGAETPSESVNYPSMGNIRYDFRVMDSRQAQKFPGREIYAIGPAASIDYSSSEIDARRGQDYTGNEASKVALFRLASRTAAFAANREGDDYE